MGFRFFMALSSSDGLLWVNGPLRVGNLGSSDCLAPGTMFVPQQFIFWRTILKIIMIIFYKVPNQRRFPSLLGQVLEAWF